MEPFEYQAEIIKNLGRIADAQERIAACFERVLETSFGPMTKTPKKVVIDGKWKVEGGESLENNRFDIPGEWDTKEEAITAAKEYKSKYDRLFLITPQGKRVVLEIGA
jgi:hypothetical protein